MSFPILFRHTFQELRLPVYSLLSFEMTLGSDQADKNGLLRQAQLSWR